MCVLETSFNVLVLLFFPLILCQYQFPSESLFMSFNPLIQGRTLFDYLWTNGVIKATFIISLLLGQVLVFVLFFRFLSLFFFYTRPYFIETAVIAESGISLQPISLFWLPSCKY